MPRPVGEDAVARQRGHDPLDRLLRLVGVGLGQQQGELVAADAEGEVAGADRALQQGGDGLQRAVARGVAVGVVDPLELVEVAQGQHEAPAVAQGALDLGAQLAHERAPVEHPRERVAIGLGAQLLDVAGGDHGHHRLVGEHAQGLQARGRGQQPVGRVVGPDAPERSDRPRRRAGPRASGDPTRAGRARSWSR